MTEDIRTLSKWLNEELTAPIDRQALARVLAFAQQVQEPVAWQCRFKENAEWSECSKEHHDWVKRCPHEFVGYEARDLYTSPPAPQATKGGEA